MFDYSLQNTHSSMYLHRARTSTNIYAARICGESITRPLHVVRPKKNILASFPALQTCTL